MGEHLTASSSRRLKNRIRCRFESTAESEENVKTICPKVRNLCVGTVFWQENAHDDTQAFLEPDGSVSSQIHGRDRIHGRSPLLRLQSEERLVALVRRGNVAAFQCLGRYQTRLLSFCRHLVGPARMPKSVAGCPRLRLQRDGRGRRPINVRPWLYRIARNRSLNHMRRTQAIGVDSMDIHLSELVRAPRTRCTSREDFRALVPISGDLPETQRTALVLREMENLSYEQIAEAMDTTVPSVKSLLVRARVSLAEAAEARLLTATRSGGSSVRSRRVCSKKPSPRFAAT